MEGHFPANTVIDEKYYYLEEPDGAVEQGDTHTNQDSLKECSVRTDDMSGARIVTCDIPYVIHQVGMYVHASYPESKFSEADLAVMENQRTKMVGRIFHKGSVVHEEAADLLHHWENPKAEL